MMKIAQVVMAVCLLVITALLAWPYVDQWMRSRDPMYQAAKRVCEAEDSLASLVGGSSRARRGWEEFDRKYGRE